MKKIEKVPATPYVRDPVTGRSVYDPYAAHLIDRYNQAKGRGPQGEKPFLKPKVGDIINISSRLSLAQYPVWVDQVSDDKWSGFHVEKKANGDWHFFSTPVQMNRVGGFNGDDVRKIVTHLSGKPKPEIPWSPKDLISNRSKSTYDMTGHFRDLPKGEGPKKPGMTQGAQTRIAKATAARDGFVSILKKVTSLVDNGKVEMRNEFDSDGFRKVVPTKWITKQGTWLRANGFPKSADKVSQLLQRWDNGKDPYVGRVWVRNDTGELISTLNREIAFVKRMTGVKSSSIPATLDEIKQYGGLIVFAHNITSPKPGNFVVTAPIPKGFADHEENLVSKIRQDIAHMNASGKFEATYRGSKRSGKNFLVNFIVFKRSSSKATKLPDAASIKSKLDQLLNDVEHLESTLNDSTNNFKQYLAESNVIWKKWKTTVRKWLSMNPYPFAWQGAWMSLENDLSFIASAESKDKAKMAVGQLKRSIQTLKGAKAKSVSVKAKPYPRNVYVEQLKNQLSRMNPDIKDPRGMAIGWFHTKWDAFLKRQMKVAKSIGANEIAGLIDTIVSSNNPNVIKEANATLQLKLAALK